MDNPADRQSTAHRQPNDAINPGAMERIDNPWALSTVIPVALAFATLGANKWNAGLPVPPTSIILGLVVVAAAFVAPTRGLRRPAWATLLVFAIPVWLTAAAYLNGMDGTKRLANVAMLALLVLVISSGRICAVSVARGAGLALVAGAAWGFATLTSSSYTGRLTGGWGDPNNAGMCALVLACIAAAYSRSLRGRVAIGLVSAAAIVATFSRTSLFALAVVLLWVFAGDWIKLWMRIAIVGVVVWYVTTLPERDLTSGAFAGREGSDALRERINDATKVVVNQHPLYGTGPGTAEATVQGDTFYFHNSYEALRAEGGWILLSIVVLLYVLVFVALLRLPQGHRSRWIEASLIGVLVCAVNLGEVFFAPPVMIALGIALRHIAVSRRKIAAVADETQSSFGDLPPPRKQLFASSAAPR